MLKLINKIGYLSKWAFEKLFFNKKRPIIGVVITNDSCNLNCEYCPVKLFDPKVVAFEQIKKDIQTLYRLGVRFLTITGGEPMLWRENDKDIEDVINYAEKIGIYETILCTNGTFPIDTNATQVMVSLDGNKETHDEMDGKSYDLIMKNIDESSHDKIYIQYTITNQNYQILEKTILELKEHKNIKGILFNMYTPFVGLPRQMLDSNLKEEILDNLIRLKHKYPGFVFNSKTGLKHLKKNDWTRPLWITRCMYQGEMSFCCCRKEIVNEKICSDCQLAACSESYIIQNLEINAFFEYLKKIS